MVGDTAVFAEVPSSNEHCTSRIGPSQLQRPRARSPSSYSANLSTNFPLEHNNLMESSISGIEDRTASVPFRLDVVRPAKLPRSLQANSSLLREASSVPQTLHPEVIGSAHNFSSTTVIRRGTGVRYLDSSAPAMWKMKGPLNLASEKSIVHSKSQHFPALEHRGRTVSQSASNFPTAASYMVAVTKEEMTLLVMMRNRRTAMQRGPSAEGYRLASSEINESRLQTAARHGQR